MAVFQRKYIERERERERKHKKHKRERTKMNASGKKTKMLRWVDGRKASTDVLPCQNNEVVVDGQRHKKNIHYSPTDGFTMDVAIPRMHGIS